MKAGLIRLFVDWVDDVRSLRRGGYAAEALAVVLVGFMLGLLVSIVLLCIAVGESQLWFEAGPVWFLVVNTPVAVVVGAARLVWFLADPAACREIEVP